MLLIGLIIVGILILPRILKPQPQPSPTLRRANKKPKLAWTLRLAIVLTVLWPLCWALYFRPWQQTGLISFVAVGIVPVTIFWCVKWILAGMQLK